ncbi:MAG: TolC family protein [Holophagales bacterium]|jgi:outer membrane protein TolC|nr:TolC family protein [Holophagales bacterium]
MYRPLILVVSGLLQAALFAQAPNSGIRTPIAAIPAVQTLIALAKENNPELAVAQSRSHAEHARVGPSGALPDPEISFAVQKGPQRDAIITGANGVDASNLFGVLPGMTEYSMSLGQGIPWPGKLAARESVAHQSVKRSELGIYETTLALEADVLTSCLELLVTLARRELFASQLSYWSATEEIAKAGLDQGESSASDVIQAMREQSRLKLRLLEIDNQIQDQKDILNQLAVRDQDSPIELGASILELELPKPPEENELLEDLKTRNSEWLGSIVDIKSADASVRFAKMDRFPDFRVGAGVAKAGSMPVAWRTEVGVTLPIWSERKQNKMVARAQAERHSAESAQNSLALVLATKSRERARAWKLSDVTVKLYENELIPQGEATLAILKARFQNGGASFASIVEALNALLRDQEKRLDAIAQIHNYAILQHRASLDAVSASSRKTNKSGSPGMDNDANF